MKQTLHYLILVFLLLTSLGVIGAGYLCFFHIVDPVVFHNNPVPIWQDDHNLCVTIDYTRYTTVPVEITRTYQDGILFATRPLQAKGNILGRQVETICFEVPSTLPSGEYKIITDLKFRVNPLVSRTSTWESEMIFINNTRHN